MDAVQETNKTQETACELLSCQLVEPSIILGCNCSTSFMIWRRAFETIVILCITIHSWASSFSPLLVVGTRTGLRFIEVTEEVQVVVGLQGKQSMENDHSHIMSKFMGQSVGN